MGNHGAQLEFHLAGGAGGIKHFLEGVFVGLSPVMNALGNPKITPELKQKIIHGVLEEAGNRSVQQLARKRTKSCSNFLVCARKSTAKARLGMEWDLR